LFELNEVLEHHTIWRVWGMKRVSMGKILEIGLAVVVAGSRANANEWPKHNSPQAAGSWAASGMPLVANGNGVGAQPTQLAQFQQPGHSIIQAQPTTTRALGPVAVDPARVHGHRHIIVVFANGVPLWYPVYTYYPYGYDIPVNMSSSTAYTSDEGYVPATESSTADSGAGQGSSEYSDLGASWGQDLRREIGTWDQFVAYLRAYIVTAPAPAQADFREAFISAYRLNGATAYDKAAAEAAGVPSASPPSGPKIITMPPPSS
jgi:hypothetical protein